MNIQVAPKSEHKFTEDEAWLYCACLYESGYSDWRMPFSAEYAALPEITSNTWWFDKDITWELYPQKRIHPVRDMTK